MKTYLFVLILSILNWSQSFPVEPKTDLQLEHIPRDALPRDVSGNTDQTTVKTVVTEIQPTTTTTQPIDEQQRFVRHQNEDNSEHGVNSLKLPAGIKSGDRATFKEPETSDQNIHEIKVPFSEEKVSTDESKTSSDSSETPSVNLDNLSTISR